MNRFWYRSGARAASVIIQGLLAGLLVLCLLEIRTLTGGSFNYNQIGKSFEQSDDFYSTIEDDIRKKVAFAQNRQLFAPAGTYDDTRQIDIRQYATGMMDEANNNLNTSYTIADLLTFAENGGAQALLGHIDELEEEMGDEQQIIDTLSGEADGLESVLPASGSTLADYARIGAVPSMTLLDYYRNLCDVSLNLLSRFHTYETDSASENCPNDPKAPSNIRYYIENTATKQRYTNMDNVASLLAARNAAEKEEGQTVVFEGERKFNIMVADSRYVLNEKASSYFLESRFVGSGEKLFISVDLSYPIGDELKEAYNAHRQVRPNLIMASVCSASVLILLIVLLVISIMAAGKPAEKSHPMLTKFDQVPTEIAAGVGLILMILIYIFAVFMYRKWLRTSDLLVTGYVLGFTEYLLGLMLLLSLTRRIKCGTLWKNSVTYAVMTGTRQVYSARESSQRLTILYILYFLFNTLFLIIGHLPGIFMAIVLNLAALLYLMRDVVGHTTVREGLKQISEGKLDYKVNTEVLTGESHEMGVAVNEMGDGLQKAVDDMLRNERLRAELITNVSHDLKTPLTSIINYVDLLKREKLGDGNAAEYVDILDHKAKRLKQLTEDLIEVSKISSGNVELHPVRMQLQMLTEQAAGEYEDRFEEKDLHVKLEMPREAVFINADGGQLWRVYENLLGNMIKYAKEGTQPCISMKKDEDGSHVSVSFANVSAQEITVSSQDLLERFSRGDASRGKVEGSGLGLSIASSLTELMGGTFSLEASGERFVATLTFPLA